MELASGGREGYFAAVGDVHGAQHRMVSLLEQWEAETGHALAFVLQVGDFEPVRHEGDLDTLAGPRKERKVGDFRDFYEGRARFPWPTYIIGGNHEPYGWLEEMPHGGPLVENCHYLGRVGCVELLGLKIVGLSGIHSPRIYDRGRPHRRDPHHLPKWKDFTYFAASDVEAAIAHGRADVLMVHDWPAGAIAAPRRDPAEGEEAPRAPKIGNPYARQVVDGLEPRLILAGHMHFSYRSRIPLPSGRRALFAALASVGEPAGAFAVFRVHDRAIEEVPASRAGAWPGRQNSPTEVRG